MEYEDQIEREVIKEAIQKGEVHGYDEITETGVIEYDEVEGMLNSEVSMIRRQKQKTSGKVQPIGEHTEPVSIHPVFNESSSSIYINEDVTLTKDNANRQGIHAGNYVPFLKDEVDSDVEEIGLPQEIKTKGKE